MKRLMFTSLLIGCISALSAQTDAAHSHSHGGRKIEFPNIPGFQTLKCDFHMHTVFSDGNVWPTIRVEEALKDGLDAIAMTEHLEYQPHKDDIPHPDRNRAFDIASKFAQSYDLIVVRGSEITRGMPPGHNNAIFLTDANKLLVEDPIEAFREAKRQGAFIFWNHPMWTAQAKDGVARLTDMHKQLIAEGLLDGIEVINETTYSQEAVTIAQENGLTIMGTSDVHGLVDWDFDLENGGHRPVTLVFATEKTEAGIKEALENRRTVGWFNNILVGESDWMMPLLQASLVVEKAEYSKNTQVAVVTIHNTSDAVFQLENLSPYSFHRHADFVTIGAHETVELEVKTLELKDTFELKFKVFNAYIGAELHPELVLPVVISK
jgi:hypothetical protein